MSTDDTTSDATTEGPADDTADDTADGAVDTTTGTATSPSERGPRPRLLGPVLMVLAVAVLVLPVVGLYFVLRGNGADPKPTVYSYTVPAGTGDRINKGEKVSIMPSDLHLKVGDHLVIRNDDVRVQTVGLFTVRPGETVDTPFPKPGVFKGACTMSSDGQIVITVT